MAESVFPIEETDNYVRSILSKAGKIKKGATDAEVLAHLLPHVIAQESGGNPNAVSPKGAVGLLQTMPATLRDPGFGVKPAADNSPEEQARVGKDYLAAMIHRYPGRPDLALAAYNAGPQRADQWAKNAVGSDGVFRASSGIEGITHVAEGLGPLPSTEDPSAEQPRVGLRQFFEDVVGRDFSTSAIMRAHEDAGIKYDPNFRIEDLSDKEWKQVTEGIPEQYWDGLAMASSRAHLDLLAMRIRSSIQAEQEIGAYGGWGIAGRLAINLMDPLGVAVGLGTGGIGVLDKGTRLARAAAAARVAGRFAEAGTEVKALENLARASAWQGAGKAAGEAFAINSTFAAATGADDPTRDGWDVLQAGLTGAVLGGASSRVFNGRALRDVQHAYVREKNLLEIAELNDRLDRQHADLSNQLADLAKQRQTLGDYHPDVIAAQKDVEALQASLKETADARRSALAQQATGALKRSELGALRRETEGLRRQMRAADTLPQEVEARMLKEDIAAMGEAEATSKQRTKLRQGAAKLEATQRIATIRANLQRAETLLGRHQAAEQARVELRRVERAAAHGDHLQMLDANGRADFADREVAALQRLKDATGARDQQLAALDKQAADLTARRNGIEAARAAGVQAADKAAHAALSSFGNDTLSAARFTGFDEGTHPHLDGKEIDTGLPEIGKMKLAGAVRHGPLATFSGILRGSDNPIVRKLLGPLVGNALGNKGDTVNIVGASEIHSRIHESQTAKFYSAVEPAYKDWAARNGIGMFGRLTRPVRERFMSELGRHIRGQLSEDPAIIKAAGKIKANFAEYLKMAQEAGVKGLTEVQLNDHYLPRVFDFKRLREIEQDIGSENLRQLVAGAIKAANDDMDDKLVQRLAGYYVTRMKELRVGSDVRLMQGVGWDDVAFFKRFLEENGVDSAEVSDLVEQIRVLNLKRKGPQEGSFRNAKIRQQLDENYSAKFRSQNAAKQGREESVEVRMSDLLENNVEALYGRYSRSMSGHIGLAKIGIKDVGDFNERIKLVERELGDNLDELKRVKETAEVAYKLITGQPIEDANTLTRLGRAARDYNFATTMNQVGWSQFPDSAGLLTKGYLGYTMREFFNGDAFKLFRRTDGTLDDAFARELEEWIGVGTDFHNNALFSSFDPGDEVGIKGAFGRTEHGLRVLGRGTEIMSGMAWITSFTQRLVARNIVQRLSKEVTRGGGFSAERMAMLGLDPKMAARIAEQMRAHTEFVNGDFGGKVKIVNWAKWKDVEARDAMLYAVFREARRLVQEEDLGDTTKWMHKGWGKIISQFRRFALVSYTKQLLAGVALHDAEEGSRFVVSMVMAALAYQARQEVNAHAMQLAGVDQDTVDKFREKYLGADRVAAAAFANSSYSAMLPALFDQIATLTVGERFFDTRASGLGSDIITGNPTYTALFKNLPRAVSGVAQSVLRGDRQFDKRDAAAIYRLIPWNNLLGLDPLFKALTNDLPEDDGQDPDPQSVDWFLQG